MLRLLRFGLGGWAFFGWFCSSWLVLIVLLVLWCYVGYSLLFGLIDVLVYCCDCGDCDYFGILFWLCCDVVTFILTLYCLHGCLWLRFACTFCLRFCLDVCLIVFVTLYCLFCLYWYRWCCCFSYLIVCLLDCCFRCGVLTVFACLVFRWLIGWVWFFMLVWFWVFWGFMLVGLDCLDNLFLVWLIVVVLSIFYLFGGTIIC